MTIHTGLRKAAAAAAAVAAGAALSLQTAPAANAHPRCSMVEEGTASDLSPSTQRAWANFICGGGRFTGGTARLISAAWVGSPAIIYSATGGELTADQKRAWKTWNKGAHNAGHGAAMVVSGVYVGAPAYVMDQIGAGAAPTDLSAREMKQVSFLADPTSPAAQDLPLPLELPDTIEELLAMLQGGGL